MSSVLDVSKPTPLRLFGFLFTAVGGLLIALGAISDWATVVFQGQTFPDSASKGIDVLEGKVALGSGVILLIAIVTMRLVGTIGGRRLLAIIVVASALGALAIGVVDIVRAPERFGGFAKEEIAHALAAQDEIAVDQAMREVEEMIGRTASVDLGMGLWLLVAGGAIGLIGGLLDLAWVGQQRLLIAGVTDPA